MTCKNDSEERCFGILHVPKTANPITSGGVAGIQYLQQTIKELSGKNWNWLDGALNQSSEPRSQSANQSHFDNFLQILTIFFAFWNIFANVDNF